MRALVVPIGAERYTVPLEAVREVVATPAMARVPTGPPALLGLINLRGDVVPVLDTGLLTGGAPLGDVTFAAVVNSTSGLAALASDGEPQTTTLGEPLRSDGGRVRYLVDGALAAPADVEALVARLSDTHVGVVGAGDPNW